MCVAVLTIEILFNITEAAGFWAVDERMSMLYAILRKNWVKIMFDDGYFT